MDEKDTFKKVPSEIDFNDILKATRPSSRRNYKLEKGNTCCGFFTIKTGFILYGIFDILVFLGLLGTIIHFLLERRPVHLVLYVLLALAFPNAFAFAVVQGADQAFTRKIYTYTLAVKLGILSLSIPLLFMYANRDWLFAKFCSRDGSTSAEVQKMKSVECQSQIYYIFVL